MSQKTRDFTFDIKSVDESGRIEGYGSVFEVRDHDNEIIAPGAFSKSLDWYRAKGVKIPMLWMHKSHNPPIGVWEEAFEDGKGLYLRGAMQVEKNAEAAQIHDIAMQGEISGLSIGFRTLKSRKDHQRKATIIEELRLWEVSLVTIPANDDARITVVKGDGHLPTAREFEEFLREAGFSRTMAAGIVAKGYRAAAHGEHAPGHQFAEMKRAINELKRAVEGRG